MKIRPKGALISYSISMWGTRNDGLRLSSLVTTVTESVRRDVVVIVDQERFNCLLLRKP
jgi:hypothetical protein